jgi:biopolymer transport protein ExbD
MARKKRGVPEINAGSMADIAFLLLIFFLVTTTMDVDTGIARKLPEMPPEEEPLEPPPPIREKNIYTVLVNAFDQLLVEEEPMDISQLRAGAKRFLNNNGRDERSSDNPQKAIISLQNDRGTSYDMYISVQNELAAAYRELRDEEAQKQFGRNYSELVRTDKKAIRKMYPQKISEAEPKKIGS